MEEEKICDLGTGSAFCTFWVFCAVCTYGELPATYQPNQLIKPIKYFGLKTTLKIQIH
jgi:hypothetical protein